MLQTASQSKIGRMQVANQAGIQRVTPEMAAGWLETMPYEHQRNVRQVWVDYLAEEIRRGNFREDTTIVVAYLNGRAILIDGQHRLKALIAANVTLPFIVSEVIAHDSDHVAWMYANTDIGLRRTASDLYAALDLPTELGMTRTQIDAMSAAITFLTGGLTRQDNKGVRMHRDDVLAAMRLYAPFGRRFFELVSGVREMAKPTRRAATLSVALLTLRFSVPYAAARGVLSPVDFWSGVINDDGIKASDPRKFANRHLLTHQMVSGRKSGVGVVTPARSARIIAGCFNAYIAHRELVQAPKVMDETAPLALYGVPRDPAKWLE